MPTEPASFLAPSTEENNTESTARIQAVEPTVWVRNRSPWGSLDPSTAPAVNTRGISPAPRTNGQLKSQTLDASQTTSQFFSSRGVSSVTNRPLHGSFDAPPGFGGTRNSDGMINGGHHFARGSDESSRGIESNKYSWAEEAYNPSPTEDQRNSIEFGPSSAAASRNGSLPPSRHSNEPLQYQQNDDGFPRLSSAHGTSFSSQTNGRPYADRHNSQPEDAAMAMLGRLSLDEASSLDHNLVLRRTSADANGASSNLQKLSYPRSSHFDHPHSYDESIPNGTYTPDGQPGGQYDQYQPPRAGTTPRRYGDRGNLTPNSAEFRYPYTSAGGTPAVLPAMELARNSRQDTWQYAPNPTVLDRRLRGIQQEQQPQFIPPQYQQYFAAQFRGPYNPYQPMYGYANSMYTNGMMPNIGVPPSMPLPTIMSGIEPPTGPRELDPNTVQSAFLRDFRMSSKSRRYELKVRTFY